MVTMQDRRSFIRTMMATAGAAAALTPAIARALEIPADRRTGTLHDVAHVVILTQENRSFDHYFGTMRGVRGYGDRFAIPAPPLPAAPDRTVLLQPNEHPGAAPALIAPFRLDTSVDFRLYRPLGTPHGFVDSQAAWDNGRMGAWPHSKHNHAMAHFTREDLPFQYALAEAFTLCDAYHCALHLCTNPNRLYIWTGTHDPLARGNGPAIDNGYDTLDADPRGHGGYRWTTYPERLMAAGIGFQIYQDMADNFSDNPVVGFQRYRKAHSASAAAEALLARRTITTRSLDDLRQDVMARRLPEVSWIVAPTAASEHPSVSTPLQGADYAARVLDALTANPEVWARTVLLINFDENDGLFDHVPPPAPPARISGRALGATSIPADDEYHIHSQAAEDAAYLDRPYGLGPRVPLYVVSPWSKGGHVASEVFDHTSILRFLEARFGVHEPNISAWRRAVCGDLTSCFDFSAADTVDFMAALPATAALSERAARLEEIRPPLPDQARAPVQETGLRRRRATPYDLDARLRGEGAGRALLFANHSAGRAAVFHVYDVTRLDAAPARYTVGAGKQLAHPLPVAGKDMDIFVLGPNGFHRRLTGRGDIFSANIKGRAGTRAALRVENLTATPQSIAMTDRAYGAAPEVIRLASRETRSIAIDLKDSHGWYDRQFAAEGQTWRIAGHVENGKASYSDPAAGGPGPLRLASPTLE
ncbi:phosphocholine-specific phospholipase C [Novosphingobium album (ex Liu et al. 2023)]|uniref:phospholipase C n=1 Tax=Novosphingobium album (ex Liu et al. 2023) TaxID=3031130 RepID=A0ABT5WLU4_9SPHN|nr:phospholipase C, phosphocholine-specific [Novosphingobium album (ex Liu et al. 2023)]MDE8651009.1 phospholipase C, phosphocholine-specific [Novosphingobium album (ex Liu et al. 2023)]